MTYQPHQSEDRTCSNCPPVYRPCPDQALCIAGDACAGHCSQGPESEFVNSECLRTGETPAVVMHRMKEMP